MPDRALWDLTLRLVPQYGPTTGPPRLWPGQLPDLPFELPVPKSGRVIGSYGRGQELTVLIDTDATPKGFVSFYEERMLASGWSTPAWQQRPGGFVSPDLALRAQTTFCRSAEGPALTVLAEMGADQITRGTLRIGLDPANNPCRPPADRGPHVMRAGPHIPPLEAPPDSSLVSWMSGGPDTSIALATLTTELDITAIAEHYARQLEEAGWHLTGAGESGPVAWSAWTFVGPDRSLARAILTAIREPGELSSYALSLHARSSPPSPSRDEE